MSVRINLLPEARILKLRNTKTKRLVLVACILISGVFIAAMAILLLLWGTRNLIAAKNANDIKTLKEDLDTKQTVIKDITHFNQALSSVSQLDEGRIYLSKIFDVVSKATPTDSHLTELSVDADYNVKASVKAADFETVSRFITALQNYNVTYGEVAGLAKKPVFLNIAVDTVTKKQDVTFDITFSVDKELVKKLREQSKTSTDSSQPQPGAQP